MIYLSFDSLEVSEMIIHQLYYGRAVQMKQLGNEAHEGVEDPIGRREWARGASKLKMSPTCHPVDEDAEMKFRFCKCIEQNR